MKRGLAIGGGACGLSRLRMPLCAALMSSLHCGVDGGVAVSVTMVVDVVVLGSAVT